MDIQHDVNNFRQAIEGRVALSPEQMLDASFIGGVMGTVGTTILTDEEVGRRLRTYVEAYRHVVKELRAAC
jgi:hypothetical protein